MYAGAAESGPQIATRPINVPLRADGSGTVAIAGALIEILGFTDAGHLRYRVRQGMPAETISIAPPGVRETITLYLSR